MPHDAAPLAEALRKLSGEGAELLIAFGASAITDKADVIPAAIEAAGGTVRHFGMPVDPGNLLLLGELDGRPVLGAPGCARSPAENGFDWVLNRLLAGLPVKEEDITGMGVGGLLMEIVSRPQPREPRRRRRRGRRGDHPRRRPVAPHGRAEQASGALRRRAAGPPHRRAGACLEGAIRSIVVTGHRAEEVAGALAGPRRAHRPQSRLCRRPGDLAEGRVSPPCRRARAARWCSSPTCRTSRRAVIDRLIDAFRARRGAGDRAADLRRQARQPGAVVARFLPGADGGHAATPARGTSSRGTRRRWSGSRSARRRASSRHAGGARRRRRRARRIGFCRRLEAWQHSRAEAAKIL